MNDILTFDTTGQDWANYLSHEISGNGMMCLVALLSDKPDAATLRKATADLIALQPVLGCRFDETREPPIWVPVGGEGFFEETEANDLRQGIHAIVQRAPSQGRQLEVTLLNTPNKSAICLRLDHAATDGGGAKRCLALLAQCYQLRYGGQAAGLKYSIDRSDGQVYARCGLTDYRMALRREAPSSEPITTVPFTGMEGGTVRYRWTSLPLSVIKHEDGVTINDRLLAAYILALSNISLKPCAITIHMTVDLRRYLDDDTAPAACNLSGMETIRLSVDPHTSYSSALAAVRSQTALLKSNHAGLSSAAMLTYLRTLPYEKARRALLEAGEKSRVSGTAAPIISNLGLIAPKAMEFGSSVVENILPLLPAMHAPAFMLGANGYGDTLTLSAGYYAEERSSDDVEQLLHGIKEMLK